MRNRTFHIIKLALLIALFFFLCAVGYRMVTKGSPDISMPDEAHSLFQQRYDGVTAVHASVSSCSVRVETHAGSDTLVDVRRTGFGLDSRNQPTVSMADGVLSVTQKSVPIGFAPYSYIVTVTVPEQSPLDYALRSVSGSLRLGAPGKRAELTSVSGSVRIEAAAAEAEVSSASGSIKVYGGERTKSVRAESVSGSIKIAAGESAGSLYAKSTSGSIKIAAGESAGSLYAKSTSGSIKISIPKDAGYTLAYRSGSGSVKDEYRGISYERSGSVTQGDGRMSIQAESVSGSIKITDWAE